MHIEVTRTRNLPCGCHTESYTEEQSLNGFLQERMKDVKLQDQPTHVLSVVAGLLEILHEKGLITSQTLANIACGGGEVLTIVRIIHRDDNPLRIRGK